jgi:hypothetical protein
VVTRSQFDADGWLLWSEDPAIGQRRWLKRDPDDPRRWHVRTESWLPELVYERNVRERTDRAGERRRGDDPVHVARIPLHELFRGALGEAFKADDEPYVRRYLNERDHLKTTDKRL